MASAFRDPMYRHRSPAQIRMIDGLIQAVECRD